MTIARRFSIMLASVLLVLVGLGVFATIQFVRMEANSRFLSRLQVPSLALIGNIARRFDGMRVNLRSILLIENKAEPERVLHAKYYRENKEELGKALDRYEASLISDDKDRGFYEEFRRASAEWEARAEELMLAADAGRRQEAITGLISGSMPDLAIRLRKMEADWIAHNEALATSAGEANLEATVKARRNMLIGVALAMLISGAIGVSILRRILHAIQALQTSVETVAAGDYSRQIPSTEAKDEIG